MPCPPFRSVAHEVHVGITGLDTHFYYYARGCSDMYVRSLRPLVAMNRYDAALQMIMTTERLSLADAARWLANRILQHKVNVGTLSE